MKSLSDILSEIKEENIGEVFGVKVEMNQDIHRLLAALKACLNQRNRYAIINEMIEQSDIDKDDLELSKILNPEKSAEEKDL